MSVDYRGPVVVANRCQDCGWQIDKHCVINARPKGYRCPKRLTWEQVRTMTTAEVLEWEKNSC